MSTYSRFNEIKKECSFVLVEASVLHPDRNRKYMIEKELSFVNGDWKKHKGSAPLMPFTKSESNYIGTENYSHVNLASFWIKGVDPNKVYSKMVNVSGILQLSISTSRGISYIRSRRKVSYIHKSRHLLRFFSKEST